MKKASEKILDSKKILVLSHKRPDGDSIGSQLGLIAALKKIKKGVFCINEDPVPEVFSFLENTDIINTKIKIPDSIDLIICLDISNLDRLGENLLSEIKKRNTFKINIDHHISNEYFGDINIVNTDSSSSSEIIFKLLKKLNIKIDKSVAEPLLTGIVTDTGSFRYSNVNYKTFEIASSLLKLGANLEKISREVYMSNPFSKVKLASKVIERMIIIDDKAFSYILQKDFMDLQAKMEYTDGLVNELLNIKGVNFSVLITEEKINFARISFRSKIKKYDANVFAKNFNGGGHRYAAGGKSDASIEKTLEILEMKLRKL